MNGCTVSLWPFDRTFAWEDEEETYYIPISALKCHPNEERQHLNSIAGVASVAEKSSISSNCSYMSLAKS